MRDDQPPPPPVAACGSRLDAQSSGRFIFLSSSSVRRAISRASSTWPAPRWSQASLHAACIESGSNSGPCARPRSLPGGDPASRASRLESQSHRHCRAEREGTGEVGLRPRPIGGLEHAHIAARRVAVGEVGAELDGLVCRGQSAREVILTRLQVPTHRFTDMERCFGDAGPGRSVLRIQLDRLCGRPQAQAGTPRANRAR